MKVASAEVAHVLGAVDIVDDETVRLGRQPFRVSKLLAKTPFEDRSGDGRVVRALTTLIYTELYVRPSPAPQSLAERHFLAQLSRANRTRFGWERPWTFVRLDGDVVVLEKDGLFVYAHGADIHGAVGAPGETVALRTGKERYALSPGFYFMLGDAMPSERAPAQPIVRVYFALRASGAATFVEAVTSVLNRDEIPFRAKVAARPASFGRADAAVVYLAKDDYDAARKAMRAVHMKVRDHLGPSGPLFTKPVASGAGIAEDPGQGSSFGEHRSRAIAEALAAAHDKNVRAPAARLRMARRAMISQKIDPLRPYLTLGGPDDYGAWN